MARRRAWDRLGEICDEYLSKGSQVYFEGKLVTNEWEDRDGNTRYSTEVKAQEMMFLDGNRQGQGTGSSQGSSQGQSSQGPSSGRRTGGVSPGGPGGCGPSGDGQPGGNQGGGQPGGSSGSSGSGQPGEETFESDGDLPF